MNWQQVMALWLPFVPAMLLSVSTHESAHALAAKLLGDDTAAKAGRISLYPPRHFDVLGTLIVPLFCLAQLGIAFGFGKPAPVDPGKLRRPKGDFSLVALAGPLSNFALALLAAFFCRVLLPWAELMRPLILVASATVTLNLVLGVVYSLPLPGFDGMKALYFALPDAWCWTLDRGERGSLIFLAVLAALGKLGWLVFCVEALLRLFGRAFGFPF